MYRGPSNSDYHRAPVPPSGFGHPQASFGPPPFCPPFGVPPGPQYCAPQPGPPPGLQYGTGNETYNRESFYENRPFTSHTADQSGSTIISSQLTPSNQRQLGQSSLSWSTQSLDEQNQDVRKKAEEFLRILQASDRIELPADKTDSGDRTADKHPSRARSRSRGRSRPRSRSRSRGRSRGRSRARSRGKSRPRSRTRSHSRSRAKSRTRGKSRARSRSRSHSHGKSATSSKSQSHLSPSQTKQSYRGTAEVNHSSSTSSGVGFGASTMPDLFHGLRQILQNKDLEKHLPVVKNALLRDQSTDNTRGLFLENQSTVGGFQNPQPETSTELCYGSLLPHERLGGDSGSVSNILSWNTPNQLPESKPAFQSVEDEEKFLYGEQEERSKPQAVTVPLAQTRSARSPIHLLGKEQQTHNLQEHKAHGISASVQSAGLGTMKVSPEECDKVRNLLRTIGLNPGMTEICKMAARLKEKKEEQGAASYPLLKPALEVLQALSRASKTDDSRSNRSGSCHSTQESKREEKKMGEKERERREKQIQKKRKEYLVKELEGLMKQEGSGDLIPVMGFFCQRCEEFFGDMNSAERHVASHSRSDRNKTTGSQEQHKDTKKHGDHHHTSSHRRESPTSKATSSRVHHEHRERSPDRKRNRDERSPHATDVKVKNEPEAKSSKDESKDKSKDKKEKNDDDNNDAESTKSEKKRKKKEKKLKKKEKKKKKDKKKAEADKKSP